MSQIDFYRARAAEALSAAEAATLPAVKERNQRSAAAWQKMAEQLERLEVQKARNLADKAERPPYSAAG